MPQRLWPRDRKVRLTAGSCMSTRRSSLASPFRMAVLASILPAIVSAPLLVSPLDDDASRHRWRCDNVRISQSPNRSRRADWFPSDASDSAEAMRVDSHPSREQVASVHRPKKEIPMTFTRTYRGTYRACLLAGICMLVSTALFAQPTDQAMEKNMIELMKGSAPAGGRLALAAHGKPRKEKRTRLRISCSAWRVR